MTIPTFTANPEVVRLVAEGERLAYAHQSNPAFATETALIEPVPHQRIAVYQRMLGQPRLRFLLADDAGAGKTIMTGLYVREMLSRRLIRRALIVPPAGLVGNWEREMNSLFNLPFRVAAGSEARANNPFVGEDSDLLIVSVDTLSGDRMFGRLQEPGVAPYDLVVFDEAHKLSADREPDFTIYKSDRYKLAEALAGVHTGDHRWQLSWSAVHLLLLTATPHMGKDFPYYCLWRLLEPEALASEEAFNAMPPDAHQRHFIRRTKEEMVTMDGRPLYPRRNSDTISFELKTGPISERRLYDATTEYIRNYYNQSALLNQTAARFAMTVFQRRLASSTYALMKSLERRQQKLDELIRQIERGELSLEQLRDAQRRLERQRDVFADKTADEEAGADGREENEDSDDRLLRGVLVISLDQLREERAQVASLLALAQQLHNDPNHDDAKFEKLREVIRDPRFRDEKLIIFTEHRDTLDYIVRRLEALGYAGQVAQIHGGMPYKQREAQLDLFRKPASDGGATYLVATDAAGEGLNMQFCWLMINYDIPWNPARLEQRMGRIHRYGQKHDPVIIINLIAADTREGGVMRTLLTKLQAIRDQMGSDKVYDVIGRLFEGVSLRDYMASIALGAPEDAARAEMELRGRLTREQTEALLARERALYGEGGEIRRLLPQLQQDAERETFRRLIPGYVRRYIEKAAPFIGLRIEGRLDGCFSFAAQQSGSMDWLTPMLETFKPEQRNCLTVNRPADADAAIFLHPGQRLFDFIRDFVAARFRPDALAGAVFTDPYAAQPYTFHLASIEVRREADPSLPQLARAETLHSALIGLKQFEDGSIEVCAPDYLLLLKGATGSIPPQAVAQANRGKFACARVLAYARDVVASQLAEAKRREWRERLPEREAFIRAGYDYQEAELARARTRLRARAGDGNAQSRSQLTRIIEQQRQLHQRRDAALAALQREPELIGVGEVTFIAHALVAPSSDPVERERFDAETEAIAMEFAMNYERACNAQVCDVSKPHLARAASLEDWPGFDLYSRRPNNEERAIEVKGRARTGSVEMKENEYAKAASLQDKYWLYVVYDCATPHPRLLRIQNPFQNLIAKQKGNVVISESSILGAAKVESE